MNLVYLNLLTIVFTALKLTHSIEWSWVWVLMPTIVYITIVYFLVVALILYVVFISITE